MNEPINPTGRARHRANIAIDYTGEHESGWKTIFVAGSNAWQNQPAVVAAVVRQWLDWGKPHLRILYSVYSAHVAEFAKAAFLSMPEVVTEFTSDDRTNRQMIQDRVIDFALIFAVDNPSSYSTLRKDLEIKSIAYDHYLIETES